MVFCRCFAFPTAPAGPEAEAYATVRGSYKDAQRKLTELLNAADLGTLPEPSRETVEGYLKAWLNAAVWLSGKTKERYGELAARQISPHIGHVPLQRLRPEHIEQWHATLFKSVAPRTVIHSHRLLSRVLKHAVENGTLARNVAALRKPPAADAAEVAILSPDQVSAVLDSLRGHHALRPIAVVALGTGARRGELLALEWRDVDLDRGIVHIERSVEETKAGLKIKSPKTRRSRRNVSLPPEAVLSLREHRKRQIELRLALGQGGQPRLVFGTIEDKLLSPDNLSRDWRRVCDARKLPRVSFHALRHTHASMLIRSGVDILTISRRLGHGKASVTLDTYGHLIEGSDAAAAKAIEGVLK